MEIIINFEPSVIFPDDISDSFSFIKSTCERLSQKSICEAMGIDVLAFSSPEKEELIEYMSCQDYTLWLSFEAKESFALMDGQEVFGFRVGANSGTEGDCFFRAAVIFELMGMAELSYAMKFEFYTRIMNDMYKDMIGKEIEKDIISNVNKEKASKPRHQYYEEVMTVIKATWEKYPNASQTGIHEALCSHYYGKVSRNSLAKWISNSGLRPPKPEKYSSFELVFPH